MRCSSSLTLLASLSRIKCFKFTITLSLEILWGGEGPTSGPIDGCQLWVERLFDVGLCPVLLSQGTAVDVRIYPHCTVSVLVHRGLGFVGVGGHNNQTDSVGP
jgi:hypothetical protein